MRQNYDPLDLAGQDKKKANKDLQDKLSRENEETDIKWLMGSKRGRRIIWRLLEQAGVFQLSFNTNAMQMAFNEGNRNFGNKTLSMIQASCPELFTIMLKEANNDRLDDGSRTNQ
jgi:hypothetical protein